MRVAREKYKRWHKNPKPPPSLLTFFFHHAFRIRCYNSSPSSLRSPPRFTSNRMMKKKGVEFISCISLSNPIVYEKEYRVLVYKWIQSTFNCCRIDPSRFELSARAPQGMKWMQPRGFKVGINPLVAVGEREEVMNSSCIVVFCRWCKSRFFFHKGDDHYLILYPTIYILHRSGLLKLYIHATIFASIVLY